MKLICSKYLWQRRGKALLLLAGLLLYPIAVRATESVASFSGNISSPPNVDAINFTNSGYWNIVNIPPGSLYKTANTLTYGNSGTMICTPGWEFDLGPSTSGSRTNWSDLFYNAAPYLSQSGTAVIPTVQANNGTVIRMSDVFSGGSVLLVQATNIINKGLLTATPNGKIELIGSKVDISRGFLNIPAITGGGSANNFSQTNFSPDTAIYAEYWGEGITNVNTAAVWQYSTNATNAATAASPNIAVVNPCNATNSAPSFSFTPSFDAWTNIVDPNSITNIAGTNGAPVYATNRFFRQAVFVVVSDPNIETNNPFVSVIGTNITTNALIRFTATGDPSNLFQTASVWLHSTNNAGDLYIRDTLGSETNRGVLASAYNSGTVPGYNPMTPCTGPAYRPANYTVERVDNSFTNGFLGNVSLPPSNFLWDATFSNLTVTADVSAYQAYVDDIAYDPSGYAVSNLPGQIIIDASSNLDLTRATISNSGPEITIRAKNLTGSAGAVISCQNLNYDLGSSSGTVNVQNLATNGTLPALNGTVSLWSAEWTNFMTVPHTLTTTNGTTTTNTIRELDFHVLLVDARGLSTVVPVKVQNLTLQTNAVISDFMNVVGSFLFNGQRLTLNGKLNLPARANNLGWAGSIAPDLLYFTNNGSLSIPGNAVFGADTPTNYAAFVNSGNITVGGSETINSAYYQDGGGGSETAGFALVSSSSGGFSVTASTGMVENAFISSAQSVNLAGGAFHVGNSIISAQSSLNFAVTNSLSDNGGLNFLYCDGFHLLAAPESGDLLGTTISDFAPFVSWGVGPEISHTWAGVDLGPAATGTSSNVAIGTLSLVAQAPSQLPTFEFSGYGGAASNAMYVSTLDLSQLTTNAADLASMIQIEPGMKIYFSQVTLGFTPPGGQSPAAFLEATFPNQVIQDANSALVQSAVVATTNIVISSIAPTSSRSSFVLTWNATAGATYSVLRTNAFGLSSTNWPSIVTGYPPGGAVGGPLSYTDTTVTVSPEFYRIRRP